MENKVIYQGRLTADPELRDAGGFACLEFTVAWSEKYKERETRCFLRCKAWRNTAEFIAKYFKKGQEIIVDGQLITEEWTKDDQKQSRTICNVEKAHFCGSKASSDGAAVKGEFDADKFITLADVESEELPFE